MSFVSLGLIGILSGFASGFFGIGGGSVLVPTLMLFGFGIKEAIAISIIQMVFSSLMGSYVNFRQKTLILKDGLYLGIGGFLGAMSSGFIVKHTHGIALTLVFACVLLLSIYSFFKAPLYTQQKEINHSSIFLLVGLVIGSVAISLGIGGAIFLTPILVGFLHVDIKKAVSMGLFFVVFSSISGLISMSYNGLVDFKDGILVGLFALIGAYAGAKTAYKIDKKLQKKLLLILYIIMFSIILTRLIENL